MLYLTLLIIYIYPVFILSGNFYLPQDTGEIYYMLLRYFGLVAYISMFFQYLWSLKLKVIDKFIPYDVRIKKHRILGYITLSSIVIHPVLYTLYNINYRIPFSVDPYVMLGTVAYALTLTVILTSILHKKLKLNYEKWKRIHWLSYAIFTFVYYHAILLGSSLFGIHRTVFTAMWIIYMAIGIYRVVYDLILTSKVYRVSDVKVESDSVVTITIPVKGSYKPGQFGFFKYRVGKKWQSWHPFTISSKAGDETISFTIKNLGDFTQNISTIKVGDMVKVDIPYGGFTLDKSKERIVLIAGGVGITPFHSILTSLDSSPQDKEVVLIYAANRKEDLIFKEEFDNLFNKNPNWNLSYVVAEEDNWDGLTGFVTPDRLLELSKQSLEGTFYLCGPKPMISPLKKFLKSSNVPKGDIRAEEFLFLP